ncbi:YnbE family lipoprotein [Pasteurellaceae bacterium HPA106]|uniref:YnbE family lipoprotein n=1 Tax=Spirabiliibacterium pneumoniae TaxID=221400 RepID=UPI001AADE7B9|nr:YnbE family lipoprotein [Spirabiliibacterium pneumoniae]MBE2895271.1 YnbE family lipoprotein [Spirabiliibacterium pneumoniae]
MKIFTLTALLLLCACTPKIQLETPKEGITVNLNVEVDHKIQIEADNNTKAILDKTPAR